jgi:ribonuclease J
LIAPGATDELVFLPLGGSGEIGMNLNAYGYGPPDNRKWIIVDLGITFGGQDTPGVDVILPDPSFLADQRENIIAIVLTHAHEDHIGAVAHLWPRFKTPIYATPFTAYLVREKLKEKGLEAKAPVTVVPMEGRIQLGPFDIRFITLTHSIPEPNGLAINTPLGMIWHTGDWKLDAAPQIGAPTDSASVRALGDAGVLAMVCDSTNVFVEGEAGSEEGVREALAETIAALKGKVAVTAFASNVARVESVIKAAEAAGRSVCLVGRSMFRVVGAAKSVGLLSDVRPFITEDEANKLPPSNVLYLCTGSQGESRAALARIASGEHRNVKLSTGDSVLFSSRVIPGNESAIHALWERFSERGVDVITDKQAPIHVSGHPARDELRQMYQWARPHIAIPVHGERRHLVEHAKLALELQTPHAIPARNGDIILIAPNGPAVIDEVPSGRLYVDGTVTIESDDEALQDRKRLGTEGAVVIAMTVSAKRHAIVSGPDVRVRGLSAADEEDLETLLDDMSRVAEAAFNKLAAADRADAEVAEAAVMKAVRRAAERAWGKRPIVDVIIMEA